MNRLNDLKLLLLLSQVILHLLILRLVAFALTSLVWEVWPCWTYNTARWSCSAHCFNYFVDELVIKLAFIILRACVLQKMPSMILFSSLSETSKLLLCKFRNAWEGWNELLNETRESFKVSLWLGLPLFIQNFLWSLALLSVIKKLVSLQVLVSFVIIGAIALRHKSGRVWECFLWTEWHCSVGGS